MAVRLLASVMKMIDEQAQAVVDRVVETMKDEAPRGAPADTSGKMADSISALKVGRYSWIVSTHAANPVNGFEYPARIELGQEVLPHNPKGLWFYGGWHKRSKASEKSGFAKRTVEKFR